MSRLGSAPGLTAIFLPPAWHFLVLLVRHLLPSLGEEFAELPALLELLVLCDKKLLFDRRLLLEEYPLTLLDLRQLLLLPGDIGFELRESRVVRSLRLPAALLGLL